MKNQKNLDTKISIKKVGVKLGNYERNEKVRFFCCFEKGKNYEITNDGLTEIDDVELTNVKELSNDEGKLRAKDYTFYGSDQVAEYNENYYNIKDSVFYTFFGYPEIDVGFFISRKLTRCEKKLTKGSVKIKDIIGYKKALDKVCELSHKKYNENHKTKQKDVENEL